MPPWTGRRTCIFSPLDRAEVPGLDCVVYGRAFLGPREDRSPLEGFRAERDGRVQLMAVHGEVDGRGEYGPISREDIARSGLDYLALGHIHQASGLQREGNTFWAYPGCPEGRGFDELGDKGVLYVEAEPRSCRAEFVPLCRRRYQILSVDVTGAEDLAAAVRAALPPDTAPDITRRSNFADRGGVGYSYLLDTFAPLASEAGVPDRAWENLLYRNALRIYKGQK